MAERCNPTHNYYRPESLGAGGPDILPGFLILEDLATRRQQLQQNINNNYNQNNKTTQFQKEKKTIGIGTKLRPTMLISFG